MKSKIDITEFRKRLKNNTKTGSPKLKIVWGILAIFISDSSKSFYGKFDDSKFEILINSNFFPSYYFLKGTYKSSEKGLSINYSIEPIRLFGNSLIFFLPIIVFIIINSILYFQIKPPTKVYVAFNLFLVFISFVLILNIKWQKRNLQTKFNKTFEITE